MALTKLTVVSRRYRFIGMTYYWACSAFLTIKFGLAEELTCERNPDRASIMADAVQNPSHLKFWNLAQEQILNHVPCNSTNCSCYFSTMNKDLEPFKRGINRELLEKAKSRGTTYLIFKGKLYRSKDCSFPARCSGVEYFLKQLIPKLPDTEFVLNSRDWPQVSSYFDDSYPVFSFSKTPEYMDIHFPAWSFWEGGPAIESYPTGLGRWDVMSERLINESNKWPWHRKVDKGFFRGSRTSEERDALILASRDRPKLIDAMYTKNQAWKSPADTLHAEPATIVPLEDHCRYKYLYNYRGVAASFRFKHLFLCGSLVVHFGDEWSEFFYNALQPWVHYVPMASDSSQEEIISMMKFLQQHDELSQEIAKRGQEFIWQHLRLKDVKCYWKHLLRRYSKLLKFEISLDPKLIQIR